MPKLADIWRLDNLGQLRPGSFEARLYVALKRLERVLAILHPRVENSAHLPGEDGGQVLYGGGSLELRGGTPGPPATTGPVRVEASTFVFNEAGDDYDARFEGADVTHLLFTDGSTNRVGVNEAAPGGRLHVTDQDSTSTTMITDQYGAPARHVVRRVNGTRGSESAVQANDQLSEYSVRGWHSGAAFATGGRAQLVAAATENWTSTAQGARWELYTTPNATTTPMLRLHIGQEGNVGINTSNFGTAAAKVVAIGAGTAPASSPSDAVQLYVADSAALDANLFARNEAGGVNRLTGLAVRNAAVFDKTNDVTLSSVTGMSRNVEADRTYVFVATLYTTSDAAGGVQSAIGGTASATSVVYEAVVFSGGAVVAQNRAAALGTSVAGITAVTAALVVIRGSIVVNGAGELGPMFAQNASNGVPSSVIAGSTFELRAVA